MKDDTVTILILFLAVIGISMWIGYATDGGIRPYSRYSAYEGYKSMDYTDAKTHLPVEEKKPATNTKCVQLSGWRGSGGFCSPQTGPEIIDIFSQAKGDIHCDGYGYHNSKGGLCMDDNMKRMLQTRGQG